MVPYSPGRGEADTPHSEALQRSSRLVSTKLISWGSSQTKTGIHNRPQFHKHCLNNEEQLKAQYRSGKLPVLLEAVLNSVPK